MGRKNASRTRRRNYRRKMRSYNSRSRLFNGNVESPGEFIFAWSLVFAFIVGAWALFMNTGLHKRDYTGSDKVYENAYRKNDKIILALSGEEYGAWASLCDLDGIDALSGGEVLSVITAKDEVISINYDNKELLKLSDCERHDKQEKREFSLFFGIMAALWLVYVAASVYVMCNVQRFSMRVIRLFVKPSYLTRPPRA